MFELAVNEKGIDCRHVTYCGCKDGKNDLHVAKTWRLKEDGTREPGVELIWNYQRNFWITVEGFRNHKEKKEFEPFNRLRKFSCTEYQMPDRVSRALYGKPARGGQNPMRFLTDSPYLYGCDIKSTSLIRNDCQKLFPDAIAPTAQVAVLDIETNVISGTEEIILITLSYKDRVVTAINRMWLKDNPNTRKELEETFEKHLGEIRKKRGIKWDVEFFDTPGKCCEWLMGKAHEWKPDFIEIWNINFDLPKIISTLENENFSLADVMSDPSVPRDYRFFTYTEGKAVKVMASGKKIPLHPADRWHIVECPSSFYFIDGMCLYKYLRTAKGMVNSYGLDATMKRHINVGKLDIPGLENVDGLQWHKEMQKNHPLDYVVYNVFDCIGLEMLDEKIKDVSQSFPIQLGLSDPRDYRSNPRKICDKLHFFLMDRGFVIGVTGTEMTDENDDLTVGMEKWIATLSASLMGNEGLHVIEGSDIPSLIFAMLADLDIVGTYPTLEILLNISKETTHREVVRIEGISEENQRRIGINLSGGRVNSIEILVTVLQAAYPQEWAKFIEEEKQKQKEKELEVA